MAIIDDTTPLRNQPSLLLQLSVLAGLTAVAITIGGLAGLYLSDRQPVAGGMLADTASVASEIALTDAQSGLGVIHLDSITTTLAGPANKWVRLEMALVFDGQPNAEIAQEVQQDVLAYLRTVKFHQIQGASGFQHLKSDIEERAAIRSEGKVRSVLIRTLLFE